MRILAIETSCDETAVSIVDFTPRLLSAGKFSREARLKKGARLNGSAVKPRIDVLSNIVSSQVKIHAKFGGVVPNLAKREHQRNLVPILIAALKEAGLLKISKSKILNHKQIPNSKFSACAGRPACAGGQIPSSILEREPELLRRFKKSILPVKTPDIDAIAVTYGPGLAPALWVGVNFAKALGCLWDKPVIPVNHMLGHLFSSFLQKSDKDDSGFQFLVFKFPALALLVSGGHTELVLMKGYGKYKIIGETLDDAAGEAFDKVARLLGLGYPGGPAISKAAEKFKPFKHLNMKLPRPMINSGDFNFSFSGLKTAVLYLLRDLTKKYPLKKLRLAVAKEFQDAVVEALVTKTVRAAKKYKVKTIFLGGGVAANKLLRERLVKEVEKELPSAICHLPPANLTGDNALMIALAAYLGKNKKIAWNKVQADANLKLS